LKGRHGFGNDFLNLVRADSNKERYSSMLENHLAQPLVIRNVSVRLVGHLR
jgi:hypothetical protein